MSILFVLLTFLLIMSITYFRRRNELPALQAKEDVWSRPAAPVMAKDLGFEVPQSYAFHPGHTWMLDEGRQNARVGIDAFTANLLGNIDRIEIAGLNRWVRQGQKLMTITSGTLSFDMLSPVEGVVSSVNHEAIKDPSLVTKDPYRNGWICVVKSPELAMNEKNLVKGSLVAPWMQNSIGHVNAMASQVVPALAQDGGLPVKGLLTQLEADAQRKLIHEFFLT
ncbi:MAG TPA: glycine cleavage system protein H [Candidatus Nanoarchaeia archaeon]|nr:glycine cleavage system protein H [Candidatus Nanoarchaeia archaeon]